MKKKIIAALGLLVVIETPSALAMEIEPCRTMDRKTFLKLSKEFQKNSAHIPEKIVVDLRHGLANGLLDLNRDVIIGLMIVVKEKERVRHLLGLCQETFSYRNHDYLKYKYVSPYWNESVRHRIDVQANYSRYPEHAKTLSRLTLRDLIVFFTPYANRTDSGNRRSKVSRLLSDYWDDFGIHFFTDGPYSDRENLLLLKVLTPFLTDDFLVYFISKFDPRATQPLAYAMSAELIRREAWLDMAGLSFLLRNTLFLRSPYHPEPEPELLVGKFLFLDSASFLKEYRAQKARREIPSAEQWHQDHLATLLDRYRVCPACDYVGFAASREMADLPERLAYEQTALLEAMGARTGKQVLAAVGIQDADYT